MARRRLGENLSHEQTRTLLDPLGARDERRFTEQNFSEFDRNSAGRLRRRHDENGVAISKVDNIGSRLDAFGEKYIGESFRTLSCLGEGEHSRLVPAPEDDIASCARGDVGESDPPGAGPGDADG